jgi:hypothetical protein
MRNFFRWLENPFKKPASDLHALEPVAFRAGLPDLS